MDTPPPPPEPPPALPRRSRKPILIGFSLGAVIWLLPIAFSLLPWGDGSASALILIFACFILPPASLTAAIIRRTRRVGLGLLLACGLGWMILGAICGGVFR